MLLNGGVRLSSVVEIPGMDWGNRLEAGVGVSRDFSWRLDGTLEVFASAPVGSPILDEGASPVEMLLTVGRDMGAGFACRAGGGAGLNRGLGSPSSRVVTMVDWRRRAYSDVDADGIIDPKDGCVTVPEDRDGILDRDGCPEEDADQDGIADFVDSCPEEPETVNGYLDGDGCPDLLSKLTLTVTTSDRDVPLEFATVTLGERPALRVLPDEPRRFDLPPSTLPLTVTAEGFLPVERQLSLPPGEVAETVRLTAIRHGDVSVHLSDAGGRPLDGYLRRGDAVETVPGSGYTFRSQAGPLSLFVYAPGHAARTVEAEVLANERLDLQVALSPSGAWLEGTRIETSRTIQFPLDSAAIEDPGPLQDVLALLLTNPDITLLRIEGHADETGSSGYNLDLSQRRADAARAWLVAAGVAPERLQAIGTGEARPLAEGGRRVEFLVLVWDDGTATSPPSAPPATPLRSPASR